MSVEFDRVESSELGQVQENGDSETFDGVRVELENLQAENQYLREQVDRLKERNSQLLNDSDRWQWEEMTALQSELRTLRERNQHVNEENIRLKEELRDLRQRSDESLRQLRNRAPSPKFHRRSPDCKSNGVNGVHVSGAYRGSVEEFIPGYTSYKSTATSPKMSAIPSYYIDDDVPQYQEHQYSKHFEDDASSTSSILSEVERELMLISGGSGRHSRSKSCESNKSCGSTSNRDGQILSPVGFRSCTPSPIVTQHNKSSLGYPAKKSILETTGTRPFAPRSPGDIKVGAVVKFQRQNGRISKGLVRYIGNLPGRNDTYLGLELEGEAGKHDGTYNNERYFTCKPRRGVFVAFNKIVLCWM